MKTKPNVVKESITPPISAKNNIDTVKRTQKLQPSNKTVDPLPKKPDNPSEKGKKTSGDLDETIKTLVTTTDTFVKEGNTDMVYKK